MTEAPPKKPTDMAGIFHGVQFGATIVAGILVGNWLDKKFGWSPFGTLGGLFAGTIMGFYNLVRGLK